MADSDESEDVSEVEEVPDAETKTNQTAQGQGWGSDMIDTVNAGRACNMEISIVDPRIRSTKKKLGRVKQTILFRVVVKTDLPKILPPEDPVYRRYTQFRWLHARLGEKYPGVARPPFPAKLKVGGLEPRRSGLERYMRRLVTEPSFLLSTELQIFLTANDVEMAQVMSLPVLPFLLRGWDEFNKNNADKASVWFGQALQAYIVRKDITGQFQALRFLGEVCQLQQRWTAAAKTYRQLLKVAQQMEDEEGAAIALINMARCCHQLNDFNTAVSCLNEMLDRAASMGQTHLEAVALRNIGMVHASLYDYQKGIQNFRDELQLRRLLEDQEEIMKATEAIGLMLFRMYDVEGAIETFKNYLDMAEGYSQSAYKGLALLGLGTFYDFYGDNNLSIQFLQQALDIFEGLNDDSNATVVLNNIGIYYRRTCQFGRADKHFRQAYLLAKDNQDLEMQTRCLRNMALVANRNDDFNRSVNLIAECVRLAEKVNDRRLLSQAYRTQADIFMLLNNMDNACSLYQICESTCKGTEDKVELARCLCGLGELHAGKSTPDNGQALSYFAEALSVAQAISYKKGVALASYGKGLIYRRLGDFSKAAEALNQSVEIFEALQNSVMHVRALAQFALCECYAGRYENSFEVLNKALSITEEHSDRKGSALVTDTLEAVTELQKLLAEKDQDDQYEITLRAVRHMSSGESAGALLTVTTTEVRIIADGKKMDKKITPEMVALTWEIQAGMSITLDRTPKRLLLIGIPGEQQKLVVTCPKRSLVYTVLTVLTMRLRACVGTSSASGSCLSTMQVGVPASFTITAATASGELCESGGDAFEASLRRVGPLPGEPLPEEDNEEDEQEQSDDPDADAAADVRRLTVSQLGPGGAYDVTESPAIVIRDDDVGQEALDTLEFQTEGQARMTQTDLSPLAQAQSKSLQPIAVADNGDGTYTCEFTPTISGQCAVDVKLQGLPVSGSPFLLEVTPGDIKPEMAEIPGGDRATLGGKTNKVLFAKDQYKNQILVGGAKVTIMFDSQPVPVKDLGNGSYAFTYDAGTSSGRKLEAIVDGVAILGSPYTVQLASKQLKKFKGIPEVDTDSLIKLIADASDVIQQVTVSPETYAAAECCVSPDALRESFVIEANDKSMTTEGWTSSQVETQVSSLAGELGVVTRLLQAHKTYKVDQVIEAASALQSSGDEETPVDPPAETPPEIVQAIRDAQTAYSQAKDLVQDAVNKEQWDEVAHRVETRAKERAAYENVLKTHLPQIPDVRVSSSGGDDGAPLGLADLLEKIPASYGSKTKQTETSAVDAFETANVAATQYGSWRAGAHGALCMKLMAFADKAKQIDISQKSIDDLWTSLLSAGVPSVEGLASSLVPMQAAMKRAEAGTTTTNMASPRMSFADTSTASTDADVSLDSSAIQNDDEDDEDDERTASIAPTLSPAVTGAIIGSLGEAVRSCAAFQTWAAAVQEVAAAQQKHHQLCIEWEAEARSLTAPLQSVAEDGAEVGPAVVSAARRVLALAPPAAPTWAGRQKAILENLTQLRNLEPEVPQLELEFHTLLAESEDKQRVDGKALYERLRTLYDRGFVELKSTVNQLGQLLATETK